MISKSTTFRFSTNIIKRLGEELNPSPSQGLIELVKNAYDADAITCTIELDHVEKPKGIIRITDTGNGMNADEIMNGWLVLGKSGKVDRGPTSLGRTPSGDKGLGRLAALRLGSKVLLKSISKFNPTTCSSLLIDWDKYEENSLVEDVNLTIVTDFNLENEPQGTRITLEGLNSSLQRDEIHRLARAMILLADPFGDNPTGFKPVLIAPEYADLEKIVQAKYFLDAEFHLIAGIGTDGLASAEVTDWKGNTQYLGQHSDIRPAKQDVPYLCPKCKFDLWTYNVGTTFTTRKTKPSDIRTWLEEFGGVHLYYNGLRVFPYGEKRDDWLGLNLMRVRSPELRPSTNTSVGRIQIEDLEGKLQQKTDRSGFIFNEPFENLQVFARDVLNWWARKRLNERENKRTTERVEAPKKSEREKEVFKESIATLPSEEKAAIANAFESYDRARTQEIQQLQKEIQLYRTLSTVGITSSVFAHESANNPLNIIGQSIRTIRNRCQVTMADNYKQINDPIERIIQSVDSLRVLANVTLSLVDHEKRRLSLVDLQGVTKGVIGLYQPFIFGRDTDVNTEFDETCPKIRGSVAAIEAVISNLLNNSLVAFERKSPSKRLIIVRTKVIGKEVELRVLDNGPGIQGINKNEIWLPGLTTRPNGTGLGLTIVRDTVIDLGGRVDAVEVGELGGAEIIINLPLFEN